ncbi:hypothetical protein MFM001_41700 [Mycobacterium sp. MFM001]|nr:hypothetical protein MFM001_41700 [Mycobacterium sp. MFM001]
MRLGPVEPDPGDTALVELLVGHQLSGITVDRAGAHIVVDCHFATSPGLLDAYTLRPARNAPAAGPGRGCDPKHTFAYSYVMPAKSDPAEIGDVEPLADSTARQARRVVAAYANDADECRIFLSMLGIGPAKNEA